MDAPLPPVIPSHVGVAGARKTVKHTIMAKPKETAIVIALLVIVILVLAGYLISCRSAAKKDGWVARGGHSVGTSNFRTGGNAPLWALGSIQGQEAVQRDERSHHAPMSTEAVRGLNDAHASGLIKGDVVSAPQATSSLLPLEGSAAPGMSGLLGSACQPPSAEAESELAALMQVEANVDQLGSGKNMWTAASYLSPAGK